MAITVLERQRTVFVPGICMLQLILHCLITLGYGIMPFFSPFPFCLLLVNWLVGIWLFCGQGEIYIGIGFLVLTAGHALVGNQLAPTALTSGAMYLGNLLIFYVGIKLVQYCSRWHWLLFTASYLLLYYIYIFKLENAEPLFLLSLLGLAGTARDFKLLSYFWALVIAFTFAQPYAWETALCLFLFLRILHTASSPLQSLTLRLFLGIGILLLLCVLFPVVVVMAGESPYNLLQILKDASIMQAIQRTLWTATFSTLVLAFFGIPLAYAITRTHFWGKPLLLALMDIPIVIPQSVAGIALLKVFGRQQVIGGFLFETFGCRFDGTVLGIMAAQIFVAMPFLLRSSMSAFEMVPERYERASRVLGASTFEAFRRIALPLASRGLFMGILLAWARAAGEFGAVLFIASYPETAPIAAYTRFMSLGLSETAPLVSSLLIYSLGMFFLLQLAGRFLPNLQRSGER